MFRKTVLVCLTAVLGMALAAAQGPRPRMGGNPPDPQKMVERRVEMLAARLSLTDAQKTQATAIFTDALTAAQTIHTNLRAARESLREAVKTNNTASIDTLAANIGNLTGQLTAIESKADAAFYSILTADQQAKYDEMPRRGPGPGGPGGFGPGPARRGPPPTGQQGA